MKSQKKLMVLSIILLVGILIVSLNMILKNSNNKVKEDQNNNINNVDNNQSINNTNVEDQKGNSNSNSEDTKNNNNSDSEDKKNNNNSNNIGNNTNSSTNQINKNNSILNNNTTNSKDDSKLNNGNQNNTNNTNSSSTSSKTENNDTSNNTNNTSEPSKIKYYTSWMEEVKFPAYKTYAECSSAGERIKNSFKNEDGYFPIVAVFCDEVYDGITSSRNLVGYDIFELECVKFSSHDINDEDRVETRYDCSNYLSQIK